jgi:hypothetical protein
LIVLILRILLIFSVLFFGGMFVAYAFTRNRMYLRLSWHVFRALVVLLVAYGLFYVFSRVLLL